MLAAHLGSGGGRRVLQGNERDDVLELGYAKDGARAYVCVEGGGVDVPVVLGSRSTDLRAGLGGFEGRALAPGDSVGRASGGPPTLDRVRSVHDPLRTGSSTATTSKTWCVLSKHADFTVTGSGQQL